MGAIWAYVVHPATGGKTLVPVDALEVHEARGWESAIPPAGLDLTDPHAAFSLAEALEAEVEAARVEVEGLRGKDLDEALDRADLPKAGTVKQKQARLAEHEAELATTTTNEGDSA